jgi:hypothetical protein
MDHSTLFLTGMQRCGTTLLDKLLSAHSQISILSQPFPLLFIEAKPSFLQQPSKDGAEYPLGNLFLESESKSRLGSKRSALESGRGTKSETDPLGKDVDA